VVADRLADIFALMAQYEREHPQSATLCAVAAELTELSGAGISLSSSGDEMTKLCTSNRVAENLMDLEITVGEGPGSEASRSGEANDEVDLMAPEISRWMAYSPEAVVAGARAVFGFPVRIGAVRFGALSLFRDSPGPLSETQSSDAYLMASVIGRAVLAMQAGAPSGSLLGELQGQSTFDFSVHQAAGMLSVQGSLSMKDALVALRAHAFAVKITSAALAQQMISRRVAFDPESGTWQEMGTRDGN